MTSTTPCPYVPYHLLQHHPPSVDFLASGTLPQPTAISGFFCRHQSCASPPGSSTFLSTVPTTSFFFFLYGLCRTLEPCRGEPQAREQVHKSANPRRAGAEVIVIGTGRPTYCIHFPMFRSPMTILPSRPGGDTNCETRLPLC